MPQDPLHLAKELSSLQDLLRDGTRDARGVELYASKHTKKWMLELTNDLYPSVDGVDNDDPFGDVLVRGLRQLELEARNILKEATVDSPGLVVCCIINAVYLASSDRRRGNLEQLQRAVLESEAREWLEVLLVALYMIRDLSRDSGLSTNLSILSIDVSARIRDLLERILMAPLVLAMVLYEWTIEQIGASITRAISKTRCLPLIDLWGSVVVWLYDQRTGFLRRAQGFVANKLIAQRRELNQAYELVGAVSTRHDALIHYNWRRIDQLIEIIETLLQTFDLFRVCRVPYATEAEVDDSAGTYIGTRGLPIDDDGGEDDDSTDGDGSTGGDDTDSSFGGGGNGGGNGGGTGGGNGDDSTIGPGNPGDYVFFTPGNVREVLIQKFNYSAADADTFISESNCRQSLSQETLDILNDLGI